MSDIVKMLKSIRFWFCAIFTAAFYLGKADILTEELAKAIELFTALGVAIRSVDRSVDKIIEK